MLLSAASRFTTPMASIPAQNEPAGLGESAAFDVPRGDSTAPAMTAEDLLRSAFKYQDALVSYAYGLLQDWALAQDAVQEAFIVLQKKHAEFHPGASVFAWARQIVRFETLNILRSRQRESCFVDEELFTLVDQQFERYFDQEVVGAFEARKVAL